MECKYCKQEIGDRSSEDCMRNPHRLYGDPNTDNRPEYREHTGDEPDHAEDHLSCWCKPAYDKLAGKWVHNLKFKKKSKAILTHSAHG